MKVGDGTRERHERWGGEEQRTIDIKEVEGEKRRG